MNFLRIKWFWGLNEVKCVGDDTCNTRGEAREFRESCGQNSPC